MFFGRKKSFIVNWWVAQRGDRFKFIDITDKRNITKDSVIVGSTVAPFPEYSMSKNSVVKVTKRGVYTASGRFYPFSTAHPIYLLFLREIHLPFESIIASKWECIDATNNIYLADIEYPSGEKQEEVLFDFTNLMNDEIVFLGISDSLDDVVVVNIFDTRRLSDNRTINGAASIDIYQTSIEFEKSRKKAIKDLKKVMKKQRKDMDS